MIDVAAIRQAYHRDELRSISHVLCGNNPADVFTKNTTNQVFDRILSHNLCEHPIETYIRHSMPVSDRGSQ